MTNKKNITFKDSTIIINKDTIKWKNHLIKTSNISHVWLGSNKPKCFPLQYVLILFFIALSSLNFIATIALLFTLFLYLVCWLYRNRKKTDKKYIHLETYSNEIYSFVSEEKEFIHKAYEIIRDSVEKNNIVSNIQISFVGKGKIIDESLGKEIKKESQVLSIIPDAADKVLINDLQKLFASLSQKEGDNKEVLNLVEETIKLINTNDIDKKKKFLAEFVTLGLINDCNELGLSTLINQIKNSLY